MPVTLKVCTSIVSISHRGGEEEIIFPWREGTYLTGRCSSSNSLGDWYEQYCFPTSVGFLFLPSLLLSFMTFALLSQRKLGTPWTSFKMWYPDRARPRSAQVLLVSVSEGVRRTTSPRQVSTFPPGKYNFSSVSGFFLEQRSMRSQQEEGNLRWNKTNCFESVCACGFLFNLV